MRKNGIKKNKCWKMAGLEVNFTVCAHNLLLIVLLRKMILHNFLARRCIVIDVGEAHPFFLMLGKDDGIANGSQIHFCQLAQLLHQLITSLLIQIEGIVLHQVTCPILFSHIHDTVQCCIFIKHLRTVLLCVFLCVTFEEISLALLTRGE